MHRFEPTTMDLQGLLEQYVQRQQPEKRKITYDRKELQAEEISVEYIRRNADGSIQRLTMHKTTIKAVWTTIVAETEKNNNTIGLMRLVPFDDWESRSMPRRKLFAEGLPVQTNDCILSCLRKQPIENPILIVRWVEPGESPQTTRRTTYSEKELHAEDLTIAYVVHNADGSFDTVKMRKTSVKAAWTTIISETQSNNTTISDMRMAALDEWGKPNTLKRNVYKQGIQVQPNQCLRKFLRKTPIENPVLLVCWDIPAAAEPHQHDPSICCNKRKEWQYFLFTNGTGESGPIVLVHSATGISQLDEEGIQSVGSSKFLDWITRKNHDEKWEIISLLGMAASVRVKV